MIIRYALHKPGYNEPDTFTCTTKNDAEIKGKANEIADLVNLNDDIHSLRALLLLG